MTPDIINALFEMGGAAFLVLNVRALRRDRVLRGVSAWPVVFFTAWGAWNVYLYPSLGMPLSAAAGVLVLAVNSVWLWMVVDLRRRPVLKSKEG